MLLYEFIKGMSIQIQRCHIFYDGFVIEVVYDKKAL